MLDPSTVFDEIDGLSPTSPAVIFLIVFMRTSTGKEPCQL
jgi:hypothetical protein